MTEITKEQIQSGEFVHVGSVDVDAGSIWIGDPCYVLKDPDESRPSDLGTSWSDICERFFQRSGYDKVRDEWSDYSRRRDRAVHDTFMERVRDPEQCFGSAARAIFEEIEKAWTEANPFVPTCLDTGVANFTHDLGHGGMGLMLNTNYGDGTYGVYVKYVDGRPGVVMIDFVGEMNREDLGEVSEELETEGST